MLSMVRPTHHGGGDRGCFDQMLEGLTGKSLDYAAPLRSFMANIDAASLGNAIAGGCMLW